MFINEEKFRGEDQRGNYGKFTLTADGAWSYETTDSNHHLMTVGSSVKDEFDIVSVDGTTRKVSITIAGTKNPEPLTADDGHGDTISYYEVPNEGLLKLREEITKDGPYFTAFNGWTQNRATHQQIFKLEEGKRYRFLMQGVTLNDSELEILGPLDIENKRYSVVQQPELGTVTINKHTGSWLYSANEAKPTNDDNSVIKFGVASSNPVLVPKDSDFFSSGNNASRTKAGTENSASEYLLKINGHNISFKASEDGTSSGDGRSTANLDTDMSFEIIGNLIPGKTPYAVYDINYPRLFLFIENDGSSTTAQIAEAINNTNIRVIEDTVRDTDGNYLIPSADYANVDPSRIFFDAAAQEIIEISGINRTSTRMNKTRAGGIFYKWIAGNNDGDFMGNNAELFISPSSTGYYLLGAMSKRGYGTNFETGSFDIIAEQVETDEFTQKAGQLINIEESGDLVQPSTWGSNEIKDGEIDASTLNKEIINSNHVFSNFEERRKFPVSFTLFPGDLVHRGKKYFQRLERKSN